MAVDRAKRKAPTLQRKAAEKGVRAPAKQEPARERTHDPLTRYMAEMQVYGLLTAEQERTFAERIEQLEIAHWRALLGERAALGVVAESVAAHFEPPKELAGLRKLASARARTKPAIERAVLRAATALRALDTSRVALAAVDNAVQRSFREEKAAARYLARVQKARLAQQRAKNDFMTANLRLVVAHARRYDNGLMPLADLVQEGNFGLMRAVERFDHRRGFRFSTYASWWIRHALNRALSDRGRLIRLPVHLLEDVQRVTRAANEELARHGVAPSTSELAATLGLTEEKLSFIQAQAAAGAPLSFERPLARDSDATLLDVVADEGEQAPEEGIDLARWSSSLAGLLDTLSPIESAVLRYRFALDGGDELTLQEVGEKYNLSRERIRQLQEQALTKLRAALTGRADARSAA